MPSYFFRCSRCGAVSEVYWAKNVKASTARPKTCFNCGESKSMQHVILGHRGELRLAEASNRKA